MASAVETAGQPAQKWSVDRSSEAAAGTAANTAHNRFPPATTRGEGQGSSIATFIFNPCVNQQMHTRATARRPQDDSRGARTTYDSPWGWLWRHLTLCIAARVLMGVRCRISGCAVIVRIWASWMLSCRTEAPFSAQRVREAPHLSHLITWRKRLWPHTTRLATPLPNMARTPSASQQSQHPNNRPQPLVTQPLVG